MTILNYINTNSNVLVCMECKVNDIQLIGFASFNILDVNQESRRNLVLDAMQLLLNQAIVEKKEKFDQISLMFQKNRSSQGALCALRILNNCLNKTSKHIDINDQINANPEDDQSGPKTPITNADELYQALINAIDTLYEVGTKILDIKKDQLNLIQQTLSLITLSEITALDIDELKEICQSTLETIQYEENGFTIYLKQLTDLLTDFQNTPEQTAEQYDMTIDRITISLSDDQAKSLNNKMISFTQELIKQVELLLGLYTSTKAIIENKLQDIEIRQKQENDQEQSLKTGNNSQSNNSAPEKNEAAISQLSHNQSQDTINAPKLVIIYPSVIKEEQSSYSPTQILDIYKQPPTISPTSKLAPVPSGDSGWASWIWLIAGGLGLGGFSYFKIFKKGEQTQENQDANKQKKKNQDIDQPEHQK